MPLRDPSPDADLRLEERQASRRERRDIVSSAVTPLPQAVVRGRLDRTQNEIGDHSCTLCGPRTPSSCDFAAPDQDVQLPEHRLFGRVGEPRDADSAVRGLKQAPGRRAMLLDWTLQFADALQHAFGRQLIE